jgi:glycosyltransferase involved in cell wall biosynthesis
MSSRRALYVWQARYPWDVRVEKVCLALQSLGYDVELLARKAADEADTEMVGGIRTVRVGPAIPSPFSLPVPGNPVWRLAIEASLRRHKPDVVIVRDIPLALPVAAACGRLGIPWAIDMAEHYPEAMRTWKKYQAHPASRLLVNTLKLPDRVERHAVRAADAIFPVCEDMRERLVREHGCFPDRIVPVLNTPSRERWRAIPERPDGYRGTRFCYHGVVIGDRDLETVVAGFDLAAADDPEITLLIAGGGESLEDVKRLAGAAVHKDRITLTGRFQPGELDRLYSETDFGVVSWKVNEFTHNTIANKFFDYAACGRPFIYAATRSMRRLMGRMQCGEAYQGDDPASVAAAIHALRRGDYAAMAAAGRAAVDAEFNWEADVVRLGDALDRLCAEGHSHRTARTA